MKISTEHLLQNHKECNKKYLGHWELNNTHVEDVREKVDNSDELQKVIYTFDAGTYDHCMTLNYEPLSNNSKIPAYKQKCVCSCGEMPKTFVKGQSCKVDVIAEYVEQNEYAGIVNSCWLYTDNKYVKVTCNEGYKKDEIFAGDGANGHHDLMKASFTIEVPDDIEDEEFSINFETVCGTSVFDYKWVSD